MKFIRKFARVPVADARGQKRHGPAADGGVIFEGVEVRRGDRQVLSVTALRLDERRIGLIGDNGSGKSTLLRLANGLLLPTRGRIVVAGLDTARHRKEVPAKVGFIFQNPDHQLIFPTVCEEIAFGLTERGLSSPEASERALALLERHGCAGLGKW